MKLGEHIKEVTGVPVPEIGDERPFVGLNITSAMTSASLAKKMFWMKYYKEDDFPIYTLKDSIDSFIREFYYGGRVEIFHLGMVPAEKLYYYDFTSLYPDMGLKDLPYGEPVWVDNFDIDKDFGFVQVNVKSKPEFFNKTPLHGLKTDGKLVFQHYREGQNIVLFSDELKLGIKSGMYEYQIRGGYVFQKAKIMKSFFEDAFKKKAESKRAMNPAMALTYKILMNSLYGSMGLRVKDRESILIGDADEPIYKYVHEGKFISHRLHGKYSVMRVLKDIPSTDFNVAIASAISSYARCRLTSLIWDIQSKGHNVFMCDTDSVITDCRLDDFPDLMKEYMPDGCGKQLGSLKNEAEDHLADNGFSKEQIAGMKELNGSIYFDGCILGGCKFYSLAMKYLNCKSIAKCKGFKKSKDSELTYKDFEDMFYGYVEVKYKVDDDGNVKVNLQLSKTKRQCQLQFRCPTSNHVSETENFAFRTPKVEKSISFSYTKGNLIEQPDGSSKIEPFVV